ncbi:hypothetical protein PG991_005528 [Apiospora marii]|uniref:2EXR domain-containing protein n=1 Tax=Apiospora marii TaxID=335849 RepID=A0ABR1S9F3_9PEZI
MEAAKKRNRTDLGLLKRLPLELREMIYESSLPQRILRAYDDREEQHIVLKCLAAPNLALVCQEMRYFCFKKYARIGFDPVWYPIWPAIPSTRGAMKQQITWFYPSKDVLFIDHAVHMPTLRVVQDGTADGKADAGTLFPGIKQSQGVAKCEDAPSWESRMFPMLSALSPILQLVETILITPSSGDTLKLAMYRGLFPKLRKILFAAQQEVVRDRFALARKRATFTQLNRVKSREWNGQEVNCVPLSQSRLVYHIVHGMTKVSDSLMLNIWNTICLPFSTENFTEGEAQLIPSHRELVERQMTIARLYWETAYTIEQDGSRLYDMYGCWLPYIDPNWPELVALLPSLPELVPVLMFSARNAYYYP